MKARYPLTEEEARQSGNFQGETTSTPDGRSLLPVVINKLWAGKIPDSRPAASVGFLTRCFLGAYNRADLEGRIEEVERMLEKNK